MIILMSYMMKLAYSRIDDTDETMNHAAEHIQSRLRILECGQKGHKLEYAGTTRAVKCPGRHSFYYDIEGDSDFFPGAETAYKFQCACGYLEIKLETDLTPAERQAIETLNINQGDK
jgi:hypothetical protein